MLKSGSLRLNFFVHCNINIIQSVQKSVCHISYRLICLKIILNVQKDIILKMFLKRPSSKNAILKLSVLKSFKAHS